MCFLEAGEEPWHGDRAVPDVEHLRARVLEIDDQLLHSSEAVSWNGEEAVEHRRLPRGLVHEEQAPTGRAGERPLGHESGESGREQRVHGIATVGQHAGAGLRCQGWPAAIAPRIRGGYFPLGRDELPRVEERG